VKKKMWIVVSVAAVAWSAWLGCGHLKPTTLYWIPEHQNYNGHTIIRAALSDTNGLYELGLRSDGVVIWRKAP
jgi:hypothetical protein